MLGRSHGRSHMTKVTRREFLGGAAGTIICAPSGLESLFGLRLSPKHDPSKSTDALIPRQKNPDNLEFPFASLDSFITPNENSMCVTILSSPRSMCIPGGSRSRVLSSVNWS